MNTLVAAKAFLLLLLIPGWLTYTDSANKFTMNYPKEWTQQSNANMVAFLSPQENATDNFRENVNVIRQDLSSQPMTMEQYTELSKKQITDAYGASAIVSTNSKTIGGQKATGLVYNMTYQGRALKVASYWFIKGKIAFLFTYTAEPAQFSKYEETAMSVINSFTFL